MSNVGEFPMKLNSWGSLLLLLLFFFRNREGFVLGKQLRHMFSLTRFNELHFIIVYTKKEECQFYYYFLLIQISKFRFRF